MIKRQLSTKPSCVQCQKDVSMCIFAKIKYWHTKVTETIALFLCIVVWYNKHKGWGGEEGNTS